MGGLSSKLMSNIRPVTSMFALRVKPKVVAPISVPASAAALPPVIPVRRRKPKTVVAAPLVQVSPLRDPKHLIDAVKYTDERAYPVPVAGQDEKDQKHTVSGSQDVLNKTLADIVINPECFSASAYLDAAVAACENGCFLYLSFFVTKHNEQQILKPHDKRALGQCAVECMFEGIQAFYYKDSGNRAKLAEKMLTCLFSLDKADLPDENQRNVTTTYNPVLILLMRFFKTYFASEAGASGLGFYDLVISALAAVKPPIFQLTIEETLGELVVERGFSVIRGKIDELHPESIVANLLDLKKRYPHLYRSDISHARLDHEFYHGYSSVGLIMKVFHYCGLDLFELNRLERLISATRSLRMSGPEPTRNRIVMLHLQVLKAFRDRDMDSSYREKFYNELANFQTIFPEHRDKLFDLLGVLGATPTELIQFKKVIGASVTLEQRVADIEVLLKQTQLLGQPVVAPAAVTPKAVAVSHPFWDAKMDSVSGSGSGSLGSALAAGWRPEP